RATGSSASCAISWSCPTPSRTAPAPPITRRSIRSRRSTRATRSASRLPTRAFPSVWCRLPARHRAFDRAHRCRAAVAGRAYCLSGCSERRVIMDPALASTVPVLFAAAVAFCFAVYVLADGFDLGVGILLPAAPQHADRDRIVASVGPAWDGNETWLVM